MTEKREAHLRMGKYLFKALKKYAITNSPLKASKLFKQRNLSHTMDRGLDNFYMYLGKLRERLFLL